MRFQRLDLLKFGKFSDRSLEFPGSTTDFHLVVGPNEAGKSTLRAAILDLLFGIPVRSPHGFLHPLNELRLGASVSNGETSLDFVRIKAQRQTLRTPANDALPDLALEPFLGSIDRDFFGHMFGLDHFRLVEGGNDILNAESDIGRILFQSAAGVASLGTVRDQLAAEADKLWAPRKSAERAYYAAADQLDLANSALKKASVRTKVWADANSAVETLRASLEAARASWRELDMRRARLERVRRLAPLIDALSQNDAALERLKEATDLPEDAAQALSQAERDIARAEAVLKIRRGEVTAARESLSAIFVDESLLSAEQRVAALETRRGRYPAEAFEFWNTHEELQDKTRQALRKKEYLASNPAVVASWVAHAHPTVAVPKIERVVALVLSNSFMLEGERAHQPYFIHTDTLYNALLSGYSNFGGGFDEDGREIEYHVDFRKDGVADADALLRALKHPPKAEAYKTSIATLETLVPGFDDSDSAGMMRSPVVAMPEHGRDVEALLQRCSFVQHVRRARAT